MNIKDIIKKYEGFRHFPYKCTSGKTTIAYGRNLDDVGISEAEAEIMLERDIMRAINDLNKVFPGFAFTYNREISLIDMIFNLGLTRFRKFKKMIAAIKINDWDEAANQAKDSRWYGQVGQRAVDNVKRLREG